ncbi:hypothetical protein MsAc7_08520 [Methanolapillus millepedarum]|uniref:Uncharacterized protein n=1 Tax=Methanolapillus millepedarum TaxID=3028296 RepID=A0AA96V397_9EURY|nr:hypothetical protein MsAc7_08520 [Methanosarcinaceae archaeon Ac7]
MFLLKNSSLKNSSLRSEFFKGRGKSVSKSSLRERLPSVAWSYFLFFKIPSKPPRNINRKIPSLRSEFFKGGESLFPKVRCANGSLRSLDVYFLSSKSQANHPEKSNALRLIFSDFFKKIGIQRRQIQSGQQTADAIGTVNGRCNRNS